MHRRAQATVPAALPRYLHGASFSQLHWESAQPLPTSWQSRCKSQGGDREEQEPAQKFNEIGTPPQPVLTRWSTWLNVAEYYAKNLVKVREIVNAFEGDGILVSNAKAAVNDPNVAKLLVEIHHDYQVLPKMIQKIESSK